MTSKQSCSTLATALLLAAQAIQAQTLPNIGDALRQSQPPAVPARTEAILPQISGPHGTIEPPLTALPGGPSVTLQAIEILGNRVIDKATLAALVADGVGKSLQLGELEALAQRITKYYRAEGYFVARAYIPQQDITAGTLKIRVVEGNYGRFLLKNPSLVRDDIVQGMLDDVKKYDIVSLDTLERAMLIINDTPGVQVTRADVMPGDKVGTSDFAVDTIATPRYEGFVMLDNYGSVYTGANRLSFSLDANSPTGSGDRLALSGLGTPGQGLDTGHISYALPLTASGVRGELAANSTRYQLGNAYAALDALGTALGVDASLSYPIRRIRVQTVELSVTMGHRDLVDEVRASAVRTAKVANTATLGVSLRDEHSLFGYDGLTQGGAYITLGRLDFQDSTAQAIDAAGANTQGSYGKFSANLSRVSLLPAQYSLSTSLKLQQALNGKNLDGSERMGVTGSSAVSAYPSGELIGDDALLGRLELSHPLPALDALTSSWLAFTDYGQARAERAFTPAGAMRVVSDLGVGVSARYRGALLSASLSHRWQHALPLSEPFPRNKLLLQGGYIF